MIVKEKNGYEVKSEEGKNLGGPYETKEQAEHRLAQVEYFKHLHNETHKKYGVNK